MHQLPRASEAREERQETSNALRDPTEGVTSHDVNPLRRDQIRHKDHEVGSDRRSALGAARAVPMLLVPALALSACGHRAAVKRPPGGVTQPAASASTTVGPATTTSKPTAPPSQRIPGQSCVGPGTPPGAGSFPALSSVQFVSPTVGFVGGAGRILVTTDGGAHWAVQLRPPNNIVSVDFFSAAVGWAVSANHLLGTVNGGGCWQYLGEPSMPLRTVHFVSANRGWGIAAPSGSGPVPAEGGQLVQTTDGGMHWTVAKSAPSGAQSACFLDSANGWLAAAGNVYRTIDGGATWNEVADLNPANTPARMPDSVVLQCAYPKGVWATSQTGLGAAGTSPWAVFSSQDGATFNMVAQVQFPGGSSVQTAAPGSYPGPISVVSSTQAAIVGVTPALDPHPVGVTMASGGGSQMTPVSRPGGIGTPTGLSFTSANTGWMVGTSLPGVSSGQVGVIEATTDGGKTWKVEYSGS